MIKIKNDKYKKARGGYSRILDIVCSKCSKHLFYYQKDGPGILKRAYLDRIIEPSFSRKSKLSCSKCGEILGIPMVYKKENRLAIRFFEGAVAKKTINISKLK